MPKLQRILYTCYFLVLFYVVWFIRSEVQHTIIINLVPFRTITLFLVALKHGYAPIPIILGNLLGNIVLTIPIGMLLYTFLFKRKWYLILVLSLYIPANIESIQFMLHVIGYGSRTVDIDDVLLNSIGILIGYYGAMIYQRRQFSY